MPAPYRAEFQNRAVDLAIRLGTTKAAGILSISPQSIVTWCKRRDVKIRHPARKLNCAICDKEFKARPRVIRRVCSNVCRSIMGKKTVICPCGKKMIIRRSLNRKFCGIACYAKSRRKIVQAPKRRGWNWKPARRDCLERAKGRCRICRNPATDVHHVIPYKYFKDDCITANTQTNLEALCQTCHVIAEKRCQAQLIFAAEFNAVFGGAR